MPAICSDGSEDGEFESSEGSQMGAIRPELSKNYGLHSPKKKLSSQGKQIDIPSHLASDKGHHRSHGGRASVHLYSMSS